MGAVVEVAAAVATTVVAAVTLQENAQMVITAVVAVDAQVVLEAVAVQAAVVAAAGATTVVEVVTLPENAQKVAAAVVVAVDAQAATAVVAVIRSCNAVKSTS